MPHDPRAKGSRATGMLTVREEEEAAESLHSSAQMEKTPMELLFSCPLGSKEDGALRVRCFKEPPWQGRGPRRGIGAPSGALFRLYRLLGWLTFEGEAA
ncbi:hypothetical protein AOLI_G00023780 [Acnodon oligacanthus]